MGGNAERLYERIGLAGAAVLELVDELPEARILPQAIKVGTDFQFGIIGEVLVHGLLQVADTLLEITLGASQPGLVEVVHG